MGRIVFKFCDDAVIKNVRGFSWSSINIEIIKIELSEGQRQLIEETQKNNDK